ncbi:hypothetical protein H6P81_005014 [Aristolochia fimbriata]|uniref:Uncharacterized protein n=1 Tax=Aristolochia fimbriata TaxID=158543 RepID=A0AAV7EVJ5_ARIFI|nr:hypothetical protein H6P81_005014 [Aristolochia fimbriata]
METTDLSCTGDKADSSAESFAFFYLPHPQFLSLSSESLSPLRKSKGISCRESSSSCSSTRTTTPSSDLVLPQGPSDAISGATAAVPSASASAAAHHRHPLTTIATAYIPH